jgi:hypothetical protein
MSPRLRANALPALLAAAASISMGWLGLYGYAWNDYDTEARTAVEALVHGHFIQFLQLAPLYGGSLLARAPFALLPGLWGGGELAVYRLLALPCLLAAAALGLWLVAHLRARQRPPLAWMLALGLCVANPLTLGALELGHPEDLLGGVLCVAAILLAQNERPAWAGLLLGAAIANKQWAILAIGPVLLALPSRRLWCAMVMMAMSAALLTPFVLVGLGGLVAATRATASTSSTIFQPWQDWWFLAHHGPVVHGAFGNVKVDYRTAPGWIGSISHPLIVALSLPLVLLFRWRRGSGSGRDVLGLLALLLLLRCTLDTWDTSYYPLPFLLALLTWEVLGPRGLPLLTLTSTLLAWVDFRWLPAHATADAQAALFLLWTTPLLIVLALRLYAPEHAARLLMHVRSAIQRIGGVASPDGVLRRSRSAPWAAR